MNFIKHITTSIILLMGLGLQAQIGNIKFEETTHDFGKIKEEVKYASYTFKFTNTGEGDLKLLNVRASCGCTTPSYSKEPIKPGKQGEIKVKYHTTRRPGAFRKSITITINNPDHPNNVIFIKGFVIPKSKTKGDFYPVSMGNLKMMSNHLAFNDIKTDEVRTDSMKIFNSWGHPMNIGFNQVPPHIQIKAVPTVLESGKEGYVVVTYDASEKKDFGLVYDRIAIKTNDNVQAMKNFSISARITQDFSGMSEKDLKKAPKIVFDNIKYDFGKEKSGTVVKYSFVFKNEGKKPLDILKIKTSCGCTTTKLAQKTYKKNKTGSIEIVFNTSGRKGKQHKTITVITNDPKNSEIVLNLNGELN